MEYLKKKEDTEFLSFEEACRRIKDCFDYEWKDFDDFEKMERLELEKAAILGYEDVIVRI